MISVKIAFAGEFVESMSSYPKLISVKIAFAGFFVESKSSYPISRCHVSTVDLFIMKLFSLY